MRPKRHRVSLKLLRSQFDRVEAGSGARKLSCQASLSCSLPVGARPSVPAALGPAALPAVEALSQWGIDLHRISTQSDWMVDTGGLYCCGEVLRLSHGGSHFRWKRTLFELRVSLVEQRPSRID